MKWTPGLILAIITFSLGAMMLTTGALTVSAWRRALLSCDIGPDAERKGFRSYDDNDDYHKLRCARIDCYVSIGSFGMIIGLVQLFSVICLLHELITQLPRAPLFPWLLSLEIMKAIWYWSVVVIFVLLAVELTMSFPVFLWTQGTFEIALFSATLIDISWCGVVGTYLFLKHSNKRKFPFEF